jgi:hypothetical protein
MVGGLSIITLILIFLKKNHFLPQVTVEHFHDIGKFLYGFNIFWAYIAFSQYFLIWYASIPEETSWFHIHFSANWNTLAVFLAVGHFAIPFVLFMSRHVKRNLFLHALIALWLLFMHGVDLFWQIRPNLDSTAINFSWVDFLSFTTLASFYFGIFFIRLRNQSLIPIQDPRLKESLDFHNL